jgi:cell wall-associated NlpC family hydrolase
VKSSVLICLLAPLLAFVLAVPVVRATATGNAQPERTAAAPLASPRVDVRPSPPPPPRPKRSAEPPLGTRAVELARRWIGAPYRWGGASPGGFDCSGLVYYVYKQLGVDLPHNAAELYGHGTEVPRSRLYPGDLLFFEGLGHVGIYAGDGKMIHAPQSGEHVELIRLADRYGARLIGARRIVAA